MVNMEDFAEKIQSVLSDPDSMRQLGEIAQMLGFSPEEQSVTNLPQQQSAPDLGGMPDITALMSLAGKLREAGGNDNNINLLNALRPLLDDEKKLKIDRAIKLLKIINLLPILRDSGILGGDLFGIL